MTSLKTKNSTVIFFFNKAHCSKIQIFGHVEVDCPAKINSISLLSHINILGCNSMKKIVIVPFALSLYSSTFCFTWFALFFTLSIIPRAVNRSSPRSRLVWPETKQQQERFQDRPSLNVDSKLNFTFLCFFKERWSFMKRKFLVSSGHFGSRSSSSFPVK